MVRENMIPISSSNSISFDMIPLSEWGLVAQVMTDILCEEDALTEDMNENVREIYFMALRNIEDPDERDYFETMFSS